MEELNILVRVIYKDKDFGTVINRQTTNLINVLLDGESNPRLISEKDITSRGVQVEKKPSLEDLRKIVKFVVESMKLDKPIYFNIEVTNLINKQSNIECNNSISKLILSDYFRHKRYLMQCIACDQNHHKKPLSLYQLSIQKVIALLPDMEIILLLQIFDTAGQLDTRSQILLRSAVVKISKKHWPDIFNQIHLFDQVIKTVGELLLYSFFIFEEFEIATLVDFMDFALSYKIYELTRVVKDLLLSEELLLTTFGISKTKAIVYIECIRKISNYSLIKIIRLPGYDFLSEEEKKDIQIWCTKTSVDIN